MHDILLSVKDLTIISGDKVLVKNASFELARGSVFGLVGESGSGKTLSALSLLGLLPRGVTIASGSAKLTGSGIPTELYLADTKQLNTIRGNRISMIFQEPMTSLNPSMRCGKQAMETLHTKLGFSRSAAREKVLELFREVRLPDPEAIFRAWPHELSGGQRQRVMIAMALSTSPDLLIADEPTTALDVTVQKSILDLLLDLREKYALSILFITHDLMVLNQIADFIAVMYRGEIVESGTKDSILMHPATPYAKGLIACKPKLNDQASRLLTIADFMAGTPEKVKNKSNPVHNPDREILLTIKDLSVSFSTKRRAIKAVNSVSFDVFKGETLGLVGESGCGKTTLGRTILQLINAESGSVLYRGRALNEMPPKALRKIRRKIQIVFQDPYSSLNPSKTISSILTEPLLIHHLVSGRKEANDKVLGLLDQVGLPEDALNLYPHQFSGGQRQRIGIARALACEPEFIVLDESVSALDVSVQAQILNLLNDLKEEFNLTYIFISHDLTVVKYMSDRLMVMSEGEIVESGEAGEIFINPANEYTKKLINSIPG